MMGKSIFLNFVWEKIQGNSRNSSIG